MKMKKPKAYRMRPTPPPMKVEIKQKASQKMLKPRKKTRNSGLDSPFVELIYDTPLIGGTVIGSRDGSPYTMRHLQS